MTIHKPSRPEQTPHPTYFEQNCLILGDKLLELGVQVRAAAAADTERLKGSRIEACEAVITIYGHEREWGAGARQLAQIMARLIKGASEYRLRLAPI